MFATVRKDRNPGTISTGLYLTQRLLQSPVNRLPRAHRRVSACSAVDHANRGTTD
jgi:hypothetical protein